MQRLISFILFTVLNFSLFSQAQKEVSAFRIPQPLNIDGVLDEVFYTLAQPAKDFQQLEPNNGDASLQATEVWFFYDESAIYVGAKLYDSAPDSIYNFLSERDNVGLSDYFGVYLDPYNKGQLAYGFFITPAGVQNDSKAIKGEYDTEDNNWNAVWESKTNITSEGWIVEMRIPYSAIRFPDSPVHLWGLNIYRNIRRYNSNNSWNFVDKNISGFIHQQGQLSGIKNIKPPVRLSFSPYASTYVDYKPHSKSPNLIYKGGLDVKYGISESYTLDMMLIPDFGQIQSDDEQLNLSPFETYYDEKRQFFNEGIELFNRAGIFYSRRIGKEPKFLENTNKHEIIEDKATETQLINSTKISGRNKHGLALGFLNANSPKTTALARDTITGIERSTIVQPFTNYNVLVLDQALNNNSYISLINTNMSMEKTTSIDDDPFMANVIATEFQFRDKSLNYAISGKGGLGYRSIDETTSDGFGEIAFSKNSSALNYGARQTYYGTHYNPNDMGYLKQNNQARSHAWLSYKTVKPTLIFRETYTEFGYNYYRIINPNDDYSHDIGFYSLGLFTNNYGYMINWGHYFNQHDYYEPRVDDRYLHLAPSDYWNINIHTDQRKAFSVNYRIGAFHRPTFKQDEIWSEIETTLRVGQRFHLIFHNFSNLRNNYYNFANHNETGDSIHLARRHIRLITNTLELSYTFNNKLNLSLRGRHYWTSVLDRDYHLLQEDGSLQKDANYPKDHSKNFNAFNMDLVLSWVFAPGSELAAAWNNAILHETNTPENNYNLNFTNTLSEPQSNTFSIKLLYYIDYNSIRKQNSL